MDFFTEQIVTRKKTNKDYLYIGLIITLALIIFYIGLSFALNPYFRSFFLLFTVGVIYGAYYLIRTYNIEYEYALTNDELDIDRITAKRKRKKLITVNVRKFDLFAKISSPNINRLDDMNIERTLHLEGVRDSNKVYIAVLNHKGIKTCIYFEPNEKLLEGILKYVPSRSYLKDE